MAPAPAISPSALPTPASSTWLAPLSSARCEAEARRAESCLLDAFDSIATVERDFRFAIGPASVDAGAGLHAMYVLQMQEARLKALRSAIDASCYQMMAEPWRAEAAQNVDLPLLAALATQELLCMPLQEEVLSPAEPFFAEPTRLLMEGVRDLLMLSVERRRELYRSYDVHTRERIMSVALGALVRRCPEIFGVEPQTWEHGQRWSEQFPIDAVYEGRFLSLLEAVLQRRQAVATTFDVPNLFVLNPWPSVFGPNWLEAARWLDAETLQ